MIATEKQPAEEPPNKRARSNCRFSITPTQIILTSTPTNQPPLSSRGHNCPCSFPVQFKSPAQSCKLEVLGLHRQQLPVEPSGAGITNTTGRAEPAAIAAALTYARTLPQTASAHFANSESKSYI
eukprot:1143562-Pelagomonas_calceolata.AAC.1